MRKNNAIIHLYSNVKMYLENSKAAKDHGFDGWKADDDSWNTVGKTNMQLKVKGIGRTRERIIYWRKGYTHAASFATWMGVVVFQRSIQS